VAVVLFFGNVNQVLVRLWARVTAAGSSELAWVPLSGRVSDRECCSSKRMSAKTCFGGKRSNGWMTSGQRRCEQSCRTDHLADRVSDWVGDLSDWIVMCGVDISRTVVRQLDWVWSRVSLTPADEILTTVAEDGFCAW